MKRILAIDASKANTGLAAWDGISERPILKSAKLGEPGTDPSQYGSVFTRLYSEIFAFDQDCRLSSSLFDPSYDDKKSAFDEIYVEMPHPPTVTSTFHTLFLNYGLAATVMSYARANNIGVGAFIHQSNWRSHIIGTTKSNDRWSIKDMCIQRCHELGVRPRNHDEADAFAMLLYVYDRFHGGSPWTLPQNDSACLLHGKEAERAKRKMSKFIDDQIDHCRSTRTKFLIEREVKFFALKNRIKIDQAMQWLEDRRAERLLPLPAADEVLRPALGVSA